MFSSKEGPPRTFLQPLVSPPEWNALIGRCSTQEDPKPLSVLICGPKSSGKSTFSKLLTNKLLSSSMKAKNNENGKSTAGILFLDLDPGQPEYSIPGQLSLIHIKEPNFGPPFSHPVTFGKSKVIRSHSIAAVSPASDPDHYIACAINLFKYCKVLLKSMPNLPLVINTPGWVLGTGLDLLVKMIKNFQPTDVIYMSQDGPAEVIETLEKASKPTFFTLPSQTGSSTKTAAQLRTMQYMSYFHLDPGRKYLSWDDKCLTSVRPWGVRYSGDDAGILGVICYGEQPPAGLLADTINGSLVSVVVTENVAAIPSYRPEDEVVNDDKDNTETTRSPKLQPNIVSDQHEALSSTFSNQPATLSDPTIISTPENIPYFNPINTAPLLPKYSYALGLALIRGIDTTRERLQILTSIEEKVIEDINNSGKKIVLVSGKLDTPGWAYTEGAFKSRMKKGQEKGGLVNGDEEMKIEVEMEGHKTEHVEIKSSGDKYDLDETFEDMPWVERIEGDEGRGRGAKVWRVRRDLGKSGAE